MDDSILPLIQRCCEQHNQTSDRTIEVSRGAVAGLYGGDGPLDSLSLVRLIVAFEQEIEDSLGVLVTLADEKAMSQRTSPFRTMGTLAAYAQQRIAEEQAHA